MLLTVRAVHEIDQVAAGIGIWQNYDPAVKADLFSTVLETDRGLCLVDPIPLDPIALERFQRVPTSIFVTNINHARTCAEFGKRYLAPILAQRELLGNDAFPEALGVEDGEMFAPRLTAVTFPGGPAGETALHYDHDGGAIVMGDALINFEPHGFAFLPAKYCLDAKRMRHSVRKLLDYSFDLMLFAHGTPILSGARSRLEQLLTRG